MCYYNQHVVSAQPLPEREREEGSGDKRSLSVADWNAIMLHLYGICHVTGNCWQSREHAYHTHLWNIRHVLASVLSRIYGISLAILLILSSIPLSASTTLLLFALDAILLSNHVTSVWLWLHHVTEAIWLGCLHSSTMPQKSLVCPQTLPLSLSQEGAGPRLISMLLYIRLISRY